jgi:hypothetical protein
MYTMSVPLVNDHPEENDGYGHYPIANGGLIIPHGFVNSIFATRPGATYESTNCPCGCTIFEEDV